jgi:hypothetical protein
MKKKFKILFTKAQRAFQRGPVVILRSILNGRLSSKIGLINKELDQTVVKFKNKKGGYKILKKPLIYYSYSGIFLCLLLLLMFTFIAAGCKEPTPLHSLQSDNSAFLTTQQTTTDAIDNLAGTKWKLTGIVNILTDELTTLEPRDCEQCYTLTFITDSMAKGLSVVCKLGLDLSLLGSYNIEGISEPADGDIFCDALYSQNVKSYTVTTTELRFINNVDNYYLLFKPYKSLEQ